jgi:hypothetical protein
MGFEVRMIGEWIEIEILVGLNRDQGAAGEV